MRNCSGYGSLEHSPRVEFEQDTSSQFLLVLMITKSIECARLGFLELHDPRLGLHGTGSFLGMEKRMQGGRMQGAGAIRR